MSDIQSQGYSFLATGNLPLTNFSVVDGLVYQSDGVPSGHKGIVRDFGIIFTTMGGSVYISRKTVGGSEFRISGNISDTATGLGGIVLDEGEKITIRIGSTGAGVIQAYDDGVIEDKINVAEMFPNPIKVNFDRRGGF